MPTLLPRGGTQYADAGVTGSKIIPFPAGTAAGDKIFIAWGNVVTLNAWVLPSLWDQTFHDTQASQGEIAGATRQAVVTSAEIAATNGGLTPNGSFTETFAADFHNIVIGCFPLTGFDPTTILDCVATTRSATSDFTNPEVVEMPASNTTATDNALVISGVFVREASPTWSAKPGTETELLAGASTDAANWWCGYANKTPTGVFAQTSVSCDSAQFELSFTAVFRPASASAPSQPFRRRRSGLFVPFTRR